MSSYSSSPKTPKRSAGKGKLSDKSDSSPKTKASKRKRNESLKVVTATPVRLRTRSPARTTVSVTIENNRDSEVDGFSITAYLPQSGWKKLKVLLCRIEKCTACVSFKHDKPLDITIIIQRHLIIILSVSSCCKRLKYKGRLVQMPCYAVSSFSFQSNGIPNIWSMASNDVSFCPEKAGVV